MGQVIDCPHNEGVNLSMDWKKEWTKVFYTERLKIGPKICIIFVAAGMKLRCVN